MKLQEVKYKLLHLLLLLNQPNRLHHPKQLLLPPPRSLQNLGIGLPLLLLWLLLQGSNGTCSNFRFRVYGLGFKVPGLGFTV
ncbi:SICAvar, type II (fragment) [Plasmodium knowlesi strain H]|uniref:SICAvar, type II n=1 Tax=Plasmodium knowlesi (strain H) TaxID=5851 RepID=A0A1A7W674_PLAKH